MKKHDRECYKFLQIISMKTMDFGKEHEKFMEENFSDQRKLDEFLTIIYHAQRSQIKDPQELKFFDGFHEIRQLYEDYDKFQETFDKEFNMKLKELSIPEYIDRHPVLRARWIEKWNESVVNMFPISKSILLPRNKPMAPELFDSRIDQKIIEDMDPVKEVTLDELGIVKKLKDWDPNRKDEEKVRKAMIMGEIFNKLASDVAENPELLEFKQNLLKESETVLLDEMPLNDGKIFAEEIPYIFFLNNSDPKLYNADFFVEYFRMDRKDFLSVMATVSYPLMDPATFRYERILRFVNL